MHAILSLVALGAGHYRHYWLGGDRRGERFLGHGQQIDGRAHIIQRQKNPVVRKGYAEIVLKGLPHSVRVQRKAARKFDACLAEKGFNHQQMIVGAQLHREFLAGLKAKCRFALTDGEVRKAFFHFVVAFGGARVMDIQGVQRGKKPAVGGSGGLPGFVVQHPHKSAGQGFLVNDDGLSPAPGVAQFVFVAASVIAAAVVQVKHKTHSGVADEFLNAAHSAELGVTVVQVGEFAVHVAV